MNQFNLEEETRRGYTISKEMKKVWAVELELLSKLLEVCEKHKLRIWADGGTLLGTIREKGYIPWDDDIDMVMLRDDYDKLVSIAKEEFKSPYFFQCGYTDTFPYGFSKLRKDGTCAILPNESNTYYHQGIFIDIFPYDAIPNDEEEMLIQKNEAEKRIRVLKLSRLDYSFINFKYNFKIFKAKREVNKKGFSHYYKEYENLFRKYNINDNKKISCISFHYDFTRFSRDKLFYNDTIIMPFENISIPVPIGYNQILELQYGEKYMTPIKESSLHGTFECLNPNISFLDILPIIRKDIKRRKIQMILNRIYHFFRIAENKD